MIRMSMWKKGKITHSGTDTDTIPCTHSVIAANTNAAAVISYFLNDFCFIPQKGENTNRSILTSIHTLYLSINLSAHRQTDTHTPFPPSLLSINHDMMPPPLLLCLMIWPRILGAHMAPWCSHPLFFVSRSHFEQTAPCYQSHHQLSAPASTSQSLDRRRGGQESVTIETSAAACSPAYLLLYELKQGASIHILAREVRGAAEDKGIGRSKRGVVVVLVRMG